MVGFSLFLLLCVACVFGIFAFFIIVSLIGMIFVPKTTEKILDKVETAAGKRKDRLDNWLYNKLGLD